MEKMEQFNLNEDLYRACRELRLEKVKELLQLGADANYDTGRNYSCLNLAVLGEADEIVDLLVEYGANVNKVDSEYDGRTVLFSAVTSSASITKMLLERGAELHVVDAHGNTPLHVAAGEGKVDVVELLLDQGVEVNQRNSAGATALHWVAADSHDLSEVAGVLIKHGANVNAKNDRGYTPLTHSERLDGNIETKNVIEKAYIMNEKRLLERTLKESSSSRNKVRI